MLYLTLQISVNLFSSETTEVILALNCALRTCMYIEVTNNNVTFTCIDSTDVYIW